jgi:CubicO group peptidase (beta-lactamase class C family)
MRIERGIGMLALASVMSLGCSKHSPTAPTAPVTLATAIESARARHNLPAIAAASFTEDSIEVAVCGIRRVGSSAAVTEADLFHIGSNLKAMLATAIGGLVEQGTLSWSLTMADAFPELDATMDPGFRNVTLAQLLQHRGGVPAFTELTDFASLPAFTGDVTAQRLAFARYLLTRPPAGASGAYLYSNAGYAVAAAIAERRAGASWDALVRTRVLDPLGVNLFVGWPLDAGPNQPCGHVMAGHVLTPTAPSAGSVPALIAPAGDASFTVRDYARFAQLHLRALGGRPSLLADSTFRMLQTPSGDYAMGWAVLGAAPSVVLTHDGSAGTFYAFVALNQAKHHGYAFITNAVTPEVDAAFSEILTTLAPGTAPASIAYSRASGAR